MLPASRRRWNVGLIVLPRAGATHSLRPAPAPASRSQAQHPPSRCSRAQVPGPASTEPLLPRAGPGSSIRRRLAPASRVRAPLPPRPRSGEHDLRPAGHLVPPWSGSREVEQRCSSSKSSVTGGGPAMRRGADSGYDMRQSSTTSSARPQPLHTDSRCSARQASESTSRRAIFKALLRPGAFGGALMAGTSSMMRPRVPSRCRSQTSWYTASRDTPGANMCHTCWVRTAESQRWREPRRRRSRPPPGSMRQQEHPPARRCQKITGRAAVISLPGSNILLAPPREVRGK